VGGLFIRILEFSRDKKTRFQFISRKKRILSEDGFKRINSARGSRISSRRVSKRMQSSKYGFISKIKEYSLRRRKDENWQKSARAWTHAACGAG
jgi:hypothetical protein